MLSLSSTRNFFMVAMILGFLFIMSKARAVEIDFINPERAVIRNHMMPNNFNRNDRTISNDQWRMRNSVHRTEARYGWVNPLTAIFRSNADYQRSYVGGYTTPYYGTPTTYYGAPTVSYSSPAALDNPVTYFNSSTYTAPITTYTPAGSGVVTYSPAASSYSQSTYGEIRNHMLPENFNRNDRAMDSSSWVEHNVVVR